MVRPGKYFYDLHIHTSRHSACSEIAPEMAVAAARQRGLHGIALTEHSYVWSPKEVEELKASAGCGSFPVLAGCEISTEWDGRRTGDLLVFGATEMPEGSCAIDEVCRIVHRQGGIVIAAHPRAKIGGMIDEIHSAMIDGVEVANYRYRNPDDTRRLEAMCSEMDLAAIASSDAHSVEEIGQFCVLFEEMIYTERDLVKVIREGICRPYPKPPPRGLRRFMRDRFKQKPGTGTTR